MIELEPSDLVGWEFYAARPARSAPGTIWLPESGETFETANWRFAPLEHSRSGRLDLVVVDDQLAHSVRETALRAISLYLDQLLGEDIVETWIGEFRVESPISAHATRTYNMADLPAYLRSTRNREKKPLRKPTN